MEMETRIYFPLALTCGELAVLLELFGAGYVGTGVSSTIFIARTAGGVFVEVLVGMLVGILVDVLVNVGSADGEGESV